MYLRYMISEGEQRGAVTGRLDGGRGSYTDPDIMSETAGPCLARGHSRR